MTASLYNPRIGYVYLGWLFWSGAFGIEIGWGPLAPRDGHHPFQHWWSWSILSREAWLDFGWLALWPIHFCRFTPGVYDPEIYDYKTDRPRYDRVTWSSQWTGRRSEIVGITLFNRWYFRMGAR